MTGKRFRLDTGSFIDMQENKVLTDRQVTNLLNELAKENRELQKQKRELEFDYRVEITNHNKIKKEYEEKYADLETSCNLLKHHAQFYFDENDHIKQTIKTMIKTERTELGQSVLKQLWEQIE